MKGDHAILIVDDDYDIRLTLAEILEDEGYSVLSAANGLEALQVLFTNPAPCLILLDLMMPVMDGYAFRAEQRKNPVLTSIPVIVITASAVVRSEEVEPQAILAKPLSLSKLMATIHQNCC